MKILHAGPAHDLVLTTSGEGRKAGVHLSDILKRMAFEKDKKYNPENPIDAMTLECGFTWERILEIALASRHDNRVGYRPEQIQEDEIWMSPDWLNPEADIQSEEWKATRKSSKNWEQKVQEWLPQCKSYVRALAKQGLIKRLAVRLRVWFMVGDWTFESKGDTTLLRDYWDIDIEFDKRELEENWRQVLSAGRRYGLLKEHRFTTCEVCGVSVRLPKVRCEQHLQDRQESKWKKPSPRKNDSPLRAKSLAKARIVTFPPTKKSRSRPNG